MNNRAVAHIWAHQTKASARGSSFYFEGDTVFSYGRHFPIARLFNHPATGARSVLFTSRDYSRTTAKHKGLVRSAVSHLPVFVVDDVQAIVANVETLERLTREAEEATARAKEETKEARNRAARQARAKKKAEAEALASYDAEVLGWKLGGELPRACSLRLVTSALLRWNHETDRIETSKGAEVPASVARKVWPLLARAVAHEEANPAPAWVPFLSLPDFKWGNYVGLSLRRVALGSPVELRVGCHDIPWAEVVFIAFVLGLPPVGSFADAQAAQEVLA